MATLSNISKNTGVLANIARNTGTLTNIIKSEGIFWAAENGDTYLVGSSETLDFITEEVGVLTNIIKN